MEMFIIVRNKRIRTNRRSNNFTYLLHIVLKSKTYSISCVTMPSVISKITFKKKFEQIKNTLIIMAQSPTIHKQSHVALYIFKILL